MLLLKNAASRFSKILKNPHRASLSRFSSSDSTDLKEVLGDLIPKHVKTVKEFVGQYGKHPISEVTVGQLYGGMRGLSALVAETSLLDPDVGIRFRGYCIPECRKLLPKAPGGSEPLPEGVFWLLVTGEIPTDAQVKAVSKEWANRAELPNHVVTMLKNFPANLHPMSQLSAAVTACQIESKFNKATSAGVKRSEYWKHAYEDAMDLIAKLPTIAALIYRNLYRNGTSVGAINVNKDWSANFVSQLGYENPEFTELMRLYLTIHSDHEGANVSAHTCHLVGSALSDPYLAFAAGLNGLAGPLHGRANQDVLLFLKDILAQVGEKYTQEQLKEFIWGQLKAGLVVPGYGHSVLRVVDPRFTCLREFALKWLPNDPIFKLVSDLFKVVPEILLQLGKVKNPWPNVDAHSGVLLHYYGMTEMYYYTVLFGVSRALGCMAQLIWSRALGFPIERPKSFTTAVIQDIVRGKKS